MRSCRRFENALWAAVEEGRSSPELAAHVEQCAACRRALTEIAGATADLAGLRAVSAPDPRAALRARLTPSPRRGRLVVACAVAAACVAAALVVRAGWSVRRPGPAPEVVRSHVNAGAAAVPIAPRAKPPAAVAVVRADREPQDRRPRRALQTRHPAGRVVRAEVRMDRGGAERARLQPRESDRPVAPVSLDEPCLQTTVLYPRRPESPQPQFVTADPTYRAAPQPAQFVTGRRRALESQRPVL